MTEIETAIVDQDEALDSPSSISSKALAAMETAVTWAYDKALDGLPTMGTLDEFVAGYTSVSKDPEEAIQSLIRWQVVKAGTAGFVTGLGGLITLPVTIPANLASVLYMQLRMITAIATLRGYDVRSDQVKTMCIACLTGSAVADILKDVGIKLGGKLTKQAIMRISGKTLIRINKAVGFRLVTKAGTSGIFNLTKMLPFVGGVVGGTFDVITTRSIAAATSNLFTQARTGEDEEAEASDPVPAATTTADPPPIDPQGADPMGVVHHINPIGSATEDPASTL